MIAEYSQISTRKPQTVFKVIRGEDTRSYGESSFKAEEGGCHICGMSGHFYRTCKHFNKKYSLEQNQRYITRRSTRETPLLKIPRLLRVGEPPRPGGGSNGSGGSNGGRSNPPNTHAEDSSEQSRVALEINTENIIDAGLADEEFSLICKCEDDVIDLLLETGTVSNIVPEDRRDLVQDIRDEQTSLIEVGGAHVTARETGEADRIRGSQARSNSR